MKKDDARRWLNDRLILQQRLTIGAIAGMSVIGLIAWFLELGLATGILFAGFIGSWWLSTLAALGLLGFVQFLTLRGLSTRLGDIPIKGHEEYVTAQPLSSVWNYSFGSLETDQSWQERLIGILTMPQRMMAAAWFTWNRLQEVKALQVEPCSTVIRSLQKDGERMELDELIEKLELSDPRRTIREVSLIDGVVVVTRKTAGLSLAMRLVDDIAEWIEKDRQAKETGNS